MPRVTFIHGKPTKERYYDPNVPKPHKANFFGWIGPLLQKAGFDVAIPAMPLPFFPVYKDWEKVFESTPLDEDTTLVGHSAGAEFLLRWLSKNRAARVKKLILIAPYQDEKGKYGDFSQYELDTSLAERIGKIVIFNSLDDDEPIVRRAHALARMLPTAELIEFDDRGHFRVGHNMTSPEFPELLDEIIRP